MVFTVQSGTVEVKVHENEFTVHRNGVWQVPRGKSNPYSISCRRVALFFIAMYSHLLLGFLYQPQMPLRPKTFSRPPRRCTTAVTLHFERQSGHRMFRPHQMSRKAHFTNLRATLYRWGQGQANRKGGVLILSPAYCGVANICMLCMLCNILRRATQPIGFVSFAAATAHEPSCSLLFLRPSGCARRLLAL
jgi:hypothetical protein